MRTAGLVLDFYDDPDKSILKEIYPTIEEVPDLVKEAYILSPEQREVLRDEGYALILQNEGKTLRKFACVDAGNTLLSALYFSKVAGKLPEEAREVAERNILSAAERFGVDIHQSIVKVVDVEKTAAKSNLARKRDPMKQPVAEAESDWAARTNLNETVQGSQSSGRVAETVSTMKTAAKIETAPFHMGKVLLRGAAKGGALGAGVGALSAEKGHRVEGALKGGAIGAGVGAAGNVAAGHAIRKGLVKSVSINPNMAPGEWKMASRRVDVTGLEAPHQVKSKTASRQALGRYPLDSYADVQKAVIYFDDHYIEMTPPDRHEFAVKVASRADELGIQTTELLDRYGSTGYAPDLDAHLSSRKAIIQEGEIRDLYQELQEKRASIEPADFVQALSDLDEISGLNWYHGGEVADPYFATFGGRGLEKEAGWTWQSTTGEVHVNEQQLNELVNTGRKRLEKALSDDAIDGLQKSPVQVFESLPEPMKIIVAKMANDVAGQLAQS